MSGAIVFLSLVLLVAASVLNLQQWQRTMFLMLSGYLLIRGILMVFGR